MVVGRRERGNEVQLVYFFLRRLDVFRGVDDQTLRTICQSARYEQFQQAGKFLYKKGQRSFCWYILLSGAVFCDGRIYLPVESGSTSTGSGRNRHRGPDRGQGQLYVQPTTVRGNFRLILSSCCGSTSSFGKRVRFSEHYRISDCILLESSEMIVIDYNSTEPSVGSYPESREQLPMVATSLVVNRVPVADGEPTTSSTSSCSTSPSMCSSKVVLCRPIHQTTASTSFAASFKKACTVGEQQSSSCSVDEVEISTAAEIPSNLLPNRRLSSSQQQQ
ncbi:Rap guanine nucleotide exchange factor, partial [Trichinella spiralis]